MDATDSQPQPISKSTNSLCGLLRFQALFGITYFGNIIFARKPNLLFRSLIICYDLSFYVLIIAYEWIGFGDETFNRIFSRSANKGIMNFVFKAAAVSIGVEYTFIKTILSFHGFQLTSVINSFGIIQNRIEVIVIWIYIFLMAVMESIGTVLAFTDPIKDPDLDILFYCVIGIIRSVAKSSLTTLLLYSSFVVRHQLNEYADHMADKWTKDCSRFFESMSQLRAKIDRVNDLTGVMMLAKVGTDSLILAGCLCAFAAGGLDPIVGTSLSCFVVSCMADIIFGCRASQLIISSMSKLCKEIDHHIAANLLTDNDYRKLNLIRNMERYFRFRVMNLFDLKDVTILVIGGYVTNYAVILVQTQDI